MKVDWQKLKVPSVLKLKAPIVADFEDCAERFGYDPLVLRSFVQYQVVVHYIENENGQRKFVDDEQYNLLVSKGWEACS